MRSCNNIVSFILNFPIDRPDKNGVIYTREAVAGALESMPNKLPIMDLRNNGEVRVVGTTTSKPYDIQFDDANGMCRFTINGIILFAGTSCVVNKVNDSGEITDFRITSIGISE